MKKILSLMLILAMLATLAGCGEYTEPTTDPNSPYPMQITDESYAGIDCYLLFEPAKSALDFYVDIYAPIDTEAETWEDEVKAIFSLVRRLYPEETNLIVRVFNDTEYILAYRPRYNDLIATWEATYTGLLSSGSQITWYPNGLEGAITGEYSEYWSPEA